MTIRNSVTHILQRRDFQVITAENGDIALEMYKNFSGTFDLLMTGIIMPGLNGFQLSDQIIKLPPGIKTLFLSGYSDNLMGSRKLNDRSV